MFDFIFRRNNPTNSWTRSSNLVLEIDLKKLTINQIPVGAPFNDLQFLGRSDSPGSHEHCFLDLGLIVYSCDNNLISGFNVVLDDPHKKFRSIKGHLLWAGSKLEKREINLKNLPNLFGQWYWLDKDEDELIAFFEYESHEMQVEMWTDGKANHIELTKNRLMGKPEQRKAYQVDKNWPPEFLK